MDPSIMKLLEEDEDESMHSGADVEAFQAALNRDIGGDASTSQNSDSDKVLSQGSNHTPSQLPQWEAANQDQSMECQIQPDQKGAQPLEQPLSGMELKQHSSVIENQQQQSDAPDVLNNVQMPEKRSQDDSQQGQTQNNSLQNPQTSGMQISEKPSISIHESDRRPGLEGESQYAKLQKMSNQQATITEQASNPINRSRPGQVPFGVLLPVLQAQLDKDRAMQLQTIFAKLKKNEIPKEGFVRHMRGIVGDHMLKLAVMKIQSQPDLWLQPSSNQLQLQSQASARQHPPRMPSADSSYPGIENNAQKSREGNRQSDSHGGQGSQVPSSSVSGINPERERSSIPTQGLNKQQQQHLHFPSIYGSTSGNYNPYSGTNVNTLTSSVKTHTHEAQTRQIPQHQNINSTQLSGTTQAMSIPKFERLNSTNDPKRLQGGSVSHLPNNSTSQQIPVPWQSSTNKEQSSALSPSMAGVKQEAIDQVTEPHHKPPFPHPHGLSSHSAAQLEHGNATPGTVNDEALEKQSSRMGLSTSMSMMPSNSVSPSMAAQLDPTVPLGPRIPSASSSAGTNSRTPSKKPSIGQKKPLEALGSSQPLPSKKQKVSGAFSDQSIEQLNDVTAVSGVNLREEEEQLFSGPKEDSRVSEASRRAVQEEEEKLILQKTPLQKKLAEIMAKCGLKSTSNDVERCLSLCVEERMRGLISNLIRLSKQRVDIEKPRHRTLITSDVQHQIMTMNKKAREEWDKKQAEAERLRRLNEPEGSNGVDGEKDKDEGRAKSIKANKEEDDKMRTTAANVAARAAVGGDDMLSKWQLMAEQARQKREGVTDASGSQPGKDASRKPLSTSGRKENQDAEKRGNTASIAAFGPLRKSGRNIAAQTRVARSISVKDVIAVLEREPQMSRSNLIYRLYEKIRSDGTAE
ncbi:hypothetical protein I3843_07G173900 [Carya illinoinensis]|uniref:RST domain-containing protein n=1 Tax=Carya illinoinensis TaxID=32201 RepID=A0A922JFK8_CARIL|nr:hypothetical protein I3842_07G179500 [Carya illinoinensis]KAG6705452.1 hypothetical protein I3842_07G179500 [Carya illinoinensis]KAG7972261.1 hypothetical protein I3843_07G173900 [Carya illinoinensis]KAG7972262.1 hypothetical protein I3843_07G173900 [Carya illinoinensis]